MRARGRLILGAIGLLSWLAGGIAAFVSDNGGGAAALVAVGAVAGAFAAIGRWPTRVVVSGHELSWEQIRQTVDSQIQVAREDRPDAFAELTVLRQRLDQLQRTGQLQNHPAQEYDDAVADALHRVAPSAQLLRSTVVSRQLPDFEVIDSFDVTAAREQLSATEKVRIRVVSWNDEEDDDDLHAALAELLALSP
jgi:hypothetical protein